METKEHTELTPDQLATGIMKGWEQFVLRDTRQPSCAANVYASGFSDCTREMTLNIVAGDRVPGFGANTQANFRRGRDRERNIKSDLMQIGRDSNPQFDVVGVEERFALKDRKGRVVITGRVDVRIKIGRQSIPTEIKSWNTNLVSQVKTFEDLLHNPFTEKGAYQLLSYMYGSEEPLGFILLDRHGLPLLIPVVMNDLNWNRMEDFLRRSEAAMDAAESIKKEGGFDDSPKISALLPDYCDNYDKCKRCRYFGHTCQPPTSFAGANIITDDELLEAVQTAYENKPAAKEYSGAWEIVKERLRGKEFSVMPGFIIRGKYQKGSELKFPDDKAQQEFENLQSRYLMLEERYKAKTDKGRFILEVSKT